MRFKNKIAQYNHVFCHVSFPIELPVTQLHQANLFFADYIKEDNWTWELVVD
jgi:hypothetical protein